jgi:hypothetical protein
MAVNGDTLYRKAETTLNSKTGWFSGVSKEEKLEVCTLHLSPPVSHDLTSLQNAAEEFSKAGIYS